MLQPKPSKPKSVGHESFGKVPWVPEMWTPLSRSKGSVRDKDNKNDDNTQHPRDIMESLCSSSGCTVLSTSLGFDPHATNVWE